MRKRIFLRTKTSIPFQKTKDSNLGMQLTEEPQKQIMTAVCVWVGGGRGCPGTLMSTGQTLLEMAESARVHSLYSPSQGDQNDLRDIQRKSKMINCGHGCFNSVQEAVK